MKNKTVILFLALAALAVTGYVLYRKKTKQPIIPTGAPPDTRDDSTLDKALAWTEIGMTIGDWFKESVEWGMETFSDGTPDNEIIDDESDPGFMGPLGEY